jgi:hypothetical protein
VPFDWELVDAYHLMERFAPLRARRGDGAQAQGAAAAGDRLAEAITHGTGAQTVVMHPFLMLDAAWWAQTQRLLALVSELAGSSQAWVVGGGAFAGWLQAAPRPQ